MSQTKENWLKVIDRFQNIESPENLVITPLQRVRFWLSKIVNPMATMYHYDTRTGKFVLGDWEHAEQIELIDATSLGTEVLTCPAGYVYRVEFAKVMNGNRAPAPYLTIVKGGITMDITFLAAANAAVAIPVIGGYENQENQIYVQGPIELYPGDSITIADDNFVAADVMEYGWFYKRLAIA